MNNEICFGDKRVDRKYLTMVRGFVNSWNCAIHKTFHDYNEQKSSYRFLSNSRVSEDTLISKLSNDCAFGVKDKRVIAVVDSCTISLNKHFGRINNVEGIGRIGRNQHQASYGFFIHPIYVVEESTGLPCGLANIHIYNRGMEANPLSKSQRKSLKQSLPIENKESYKWLGPCKKALNSLSQADHITFVMDREADICEVLEGLPSEPIDVVIRSKENRRILDENGERTKLHEILKKQQSMGQM